MSLTLRALVVPSGHRVRGVRALSANLTNFSPVRSRGFVPVCRHPLICTSLPSQSCPNRCRRICHSPVEMRSRVSRTRRRKSSCFVIFQHVAKGLWRFGRLCVSRHGFCHFSRNDFEAMTGLQCIDPLPLLLRRKESDLCNSDHYGGS